ncbi:MAG TPA: CPXCG motif-containing cysteine-rich protein [Gemmatimonadaceae bacterium]|nr:CPXCG motif-containing cysteine-rich protein [Gemmatimonadaceae bacterium]
MKFSNDLPDAFDDDDSPDPETEEELDRDFPLGDGTADTDAMVTCPYCGEAIEISLDPGSGPHQEYVEDCEVCCQPWRVSVSYGGEGEAIVSVTPLDQ